MISGLTSGNKKLNIFSKTIESFGSKLIRRKFLTSLVEPFLWSGVIYDVFHSLGQCEDF